MRDRRGASDVAGEAYVVIRERILRGAVAIGHVISRRKIAAELGMSFLPVSEASLRLELEGLLRAARGPEHECGSPSARMSEGTIWCEPLWGWKPPGSSARRQPPRSEPN